MSLLRLPEYKKYDHNNPHMCDVVLSNRHARSFRNKHFARVFRSVALSYYEACIRVKNRDFTQSTWDAEGDSPNQEERSDELHLHAY